MDQTKYCPQDSERALKLAGYLMHYNGDPDAA